MKFGFLSTFLILFSTNLFAGPRTIKVGIVDTGLDLNDPRLNSQLCPYGHKDFTGTGLADTVGHGTFVAALIERYAGKGDYCLLIYKFYSISEPGVKNTNNEVSAFKKAIRDGASVINFSGGGERFSEEEFLVVKNNPQVTFVVAAGNDNLDLDIFGNTYYPASFFFKNEIVLENVDKYGNKAQTSNWGSKITESEVGEDVVSMLPNGQMGKESGTSFSTAIRTGKMIREMLNEK